MREIVFFDEVRKQPCTVLGTICPECPGNGAIFPPSAYRMHIEVHQGNPMGRTCGKCHRFLPWNRFPRIETYISASCYDCRPKEAMNRGRPKGPLHRKDTSIRAHRVWGPGQDEESDDKEEGK